MNGYRRSLTVHLFLILSLLDPTVGDRTTSSPPITTPTTSSSSQTPSGVNGSSDELDRQRSAINTWNGSITDNDTDISHRLTSTTILNEEVDLMTVDGDVSQQNTEWLLLNQTRERRSNPVVDSTTTLATTTRTSALKTTTSASSLLLPSSFASSTLSTSPLNQSISYSQRPADSAVDEQRQLQEQQRREGESTEDRANGTLKDDVKLLEHWNIEANNKTTPETSDSVSDDDDVDARRNATAELSPVDQQPLWNQSLSSSSPSLEATSDNASTDDGIERLVVDRQSMVNGSWLGIAGGDGSDNETEKKNFSESGTIDTRIEPTANTENRTDGDGNSTQRVIDGSTVEDVETTTVTTTIPVTTTPEHATVAVKADVVNNSNNESGEIDGNPSVLGRSSDSPQPSTPAASITGGLDTTRSNATTKIDEAPTTTTASTINGSTSPSTSTSEPALLSTSVPVTEEISIDNQTTLATTTSTVGNQTEDEDDDDSVLPHRRCPSGKYDQVTWPRTDAGVLAIQPCAEPYSGQAYRSCYSSGAWGPADLTECRLAKLRETQSLIFYHSHKHLVEGLYPLAEELARLVSSDDQPLKSPMDRLDALDAVNAILRAKIKIRMEDEERNLKLIQSLMTICDRLVTSRVFFTVETERNAMITTKTAEALIGLRMLAENVLRALIVSCENDLGNIRMMKTINPSANNIVMTLTHRTQFGTLIPLVTPANYTTTIRRSDMPQVIVHLEDFNKLGVGIASVWIRSLDNVLDSNRYKMVSDVVMVSVVPAVSIQVDFEETPKVEVELRLTRGSVKPGHEVGCGRMKSPRDLWVKKGCVTIRQNSTSIHCLCHELGVIAALLHQPSSPDDSFDESDTDTTEDQDVDDPLIHHHHHHRHHQVLLHSAVIYLTLTLSLALLIVTIICQVIQRRRESPQSSFILINLAASMSAIQLIFLLGAPFRAHFILLQFCSSVPLVLHYVHLVAGFWMLSHSVFLYQRLWRPGNGPDDDKDKCASTTTLPFLVGSPPIAPWRRWLWGLVAGVGEQWDNRHFLVFSTLLPAAAVSLAHQLNPKGYETRRYCWMSIEGGMFYSFIVPVSLLIMTNTVVMLLVLKRFFEHKPLVHKSEIDKIQPSLRAGVTLLPFFAVNWFLSVMAIEDTSTSAFQWLFAAGNLVQCYLVFLFHCYQRYELLDAIKSRLSAPSSGQLPKPPQLRLRKGHSRASRAVRADIPRLCIGDDQPLAGSSASGSGSGNGSGALMANFNGADHQPLLMPCSSSSRGYPGQARSSRLF